jgi:predicted nucleotidyltransferase
MSHLELQEMARLMGLASGAKQVILFGSTARGEATADSDLDFLLVMADEDWKWHGKTLEKLEPAMRARDAVHEAGYWTALDVLPLPESRYNDLTSYLASEVRRDGIVLFEGDNQWARIKNAANKLPVCSSELPNTS